MLELKDIDVVILAGGLGKRLRSCAGEAPKVLASINGTPFLDILLENIAAQGLRRVILCTGHKAEEIERHYRSSMLKLEIEFSREEVPLGTGGAFKLVQKKVQSPVFFGLNGDCFCSVLLEKLLAYHKEKRALASLVLNKVEEKSDFGSVILSENNEIISFQEKANLANLPFVSVGIYCFDQKIFDLMPRQENFSIEHDFFPSLIGKGFYGFVTDHRFLDIGTPDRYQRAQNELNKSL